MTDLVAARPNMIATLNSFRDTLEDFGGASASPILPPACRPCLEIDARMLGEAGARALRCTSKHRCFGATLQMKVF
jgi:hypothetical protein